MSAVCPRLTLRCFGLLSADRKVEQAASRFKLAATNWNMWWGINSDLDRASSNFEDADLNPFTDQYGLGVFSR